MIEIDTLSLREAGKDIVSLTQNYSEYIDKVFSRISGMSSNDGTWSGTSARRFRTIAALDNRQYRKLGDCLNNYGEHLKKTSDAIEELCRRIKY